MSKIRILGCLDGGAVPIGVLGTHSLLQFSHCGSARGTLLMRLCVRRCRSSSYAGCYIALTLFLQQKQAKLDPNSSSFTAQNIWDRLLSITWGA